MIGLIVDRFDCKADGMGAQIVFKVTNDNIDFSTIFGHGVVQFFLAVRFLYIFSVQLYITVRHYYK